MLRSCAALFLALLAPSLTAWAESQPASAASAASTADDATPLERGVARFQDGDLEGAAQALEEARAGDPDDTDAGLLLGITYYRLHRLDDAEPLLARAARDPDADTAASARIFLAMIALERDDGRRARALLDGVAASPATELALSARALLGRSAAPPLSLFAMLRPEFDSNVSLMPAAPTAAPAQADADLMVLGSISHRPLPGVPLQLEATVSYRQQAQLTDFNFFDALAAIGYDDGALDLGGSGEATVLGGAFYGAGGAGQIGYRLELLPWLATRARYGLRYRDFEPDAYAGYTGVTHSGTLGVSLGPRRGTVTADLDYVLLRDITSDDSLVATGQGGAARIRVRLQRVSLAAGGWLIFRAFDVGRRDVQAAFDASVAVDLSSSFGVIAGSTLLRNGSSEADADYIKVTAFAGVYATAP